MGPTRVLPPLFVAVVAMMFAISIAKADCVGY